MIKSIRDKALRRLFENGDAKGLSVPDTRRVLWILAVLDDITRPEDANLPGFRLHRLTGKEQDRFSIRVTGNYRMTFGWDGEGVTDLDLEDYH